MRALKGVSFHLLFVALLFVAAGGCLAQGQPGVTVYEGARLITGDGRPPIEGSVFIVENTRFSRIGRRGEGSFRPAPRASMRANWQSDFRRAASDR